MSERMRFVIRLERGERMSALCREFGISRKTGYKIWNRYRAAGAPGLEDQSRAPHSYPHRTSEAIRQVVIEFRCAHPSWGPKKLKAELERRNPGVSFPAASTIGAILDAEGLVGRRRRRRGIPSYPHGLRDSHNPNDVWCADFKGQFRLGNRCYCYPLTITDHFSRYALGCEGLESTEGAGAQPVFEYAFREYGLPLAMRTDNGSPFASSQSLGGLSRLSIWWIKLGIVPERIEPGHPEQNGRHERFHLTLKQETTRPPKANLLQQQERFDSYREEYNNGRPHEALGMKYPAEIYKRSPRQYEEPELSYPLHDQTLRVGTSGNVHVTPGSVFFLTKSLAGEFVGLREVDNDRWLVSFARIDLGLYDAYAGRFEPFKCLDFSTIRETTGETKTSNPESNQDTQSNLSPMLPV